MMTKIVTLTLKWKEKIIKKLLNEIKKKLHLVYKIFYQVRYVI